jgi:CheY-like chemotaxis protein
MLRRVLLVDDNAALAAGLARALKSEYEVLVCTDGLAALERIFTDGPFDALVVDIRMPAIDGLHLRTALLETSPEHARRIIFVTGADLGDDETGALQDRIVLRKPFGPAELRLAIQRVIGATCITPAGIAAVRPVPASSERRASAITLPAPPAPATTEPERKRYPSASFEEVASPGARRDSRRE